MLCGLPALGGCSVGAALAAMTASGDGRLLPDQAYGADPRQCLDIWPAAGGGQGPRPCLAFIHGGYWQALAKDDCSYVVEPFVRAGIVVAMIEYRPCCLMRCLMTSASLACAKFSRMRLVT